MKRLLLVLALFVAVLPGSAAAQVSCTTYFANTSMPMTDCSTPAGSVNCTTFFADTNMPMTDCTGTALAPPRTTVYVAPPPPAQIVYVQAPRPGLDYKDGNGLPRWLPQGAFLKADDALAIYVIWDQQFHAFQTWGSFLQYGGKSDLSNVVHWTTVSNWPSSYFGSPVPN